MRFLLGSGLLTQAWLYSSDATETRAPLHPCASAITRFLRRVPSSRRARSPEAGPLKRA